MDALNTNSSKPTPTGAALFLSIGLSALLAGALVFAVGIILRPFSIPLLWASVLSVTTWPLFTRLRSRMPRRPWIAALILTLALGLILLLVSIPLPLRLADEALELGKRIAAMDMAHIAQWGRTVPLVGDLLADNLVNLPDKDGIRNGWFCAFERHHRIGRHVLTAFLWSTGCARFGGGRSSPRPARPVRPP